VDEAIQLLAHLIVKAAVNGEELDDEWALPGSPWVGVCRPFG
jgi:hypothetical protein